MTLYEKFLRQAKEQIALQNLTQAEVGRAIGLSRNAISKVMNGKVTLKGDKLLELARFLKIGLGLISLSPKTMTWSGVDLEELKNAIQRIDEVNPRVPEKIESIPEVIECVCHMAERGKTDEEIQQFINEKTIFGTKVVPKFKQITRESLADMCDGVALDEDGHAAMDMIEWEEKK